DPVADQLDLPRVEPGPDLDALGTEKGGDLRGAPDRPRRSVERCEDAVAGSVDLDTSVLFELCANDRVVPLEQLEPAPVAKLRGQPGRADDVREEDGEEHALPLRRRNAGADERGDLVDEALLVAHPGEIVPSREPDEP